MKEYKIPCLGIKGARYFRWVDKRTGKVHTGIDILADAGTPIYAPCDLVITDIIYAKGYGGTNDEFGYVLFANAETKEFGTVTLQFGHITSQVAVGEKVGKGELIGEIAPYIYTDNGRKFNVDHLHFSVNTGEKIPTDTWGYVESKEIKPFINPDYFLETIA